jgi:hypothetical protein
MHWLVVQWALTLALSAAEKYGAKWQLTAGIAVDNYYGGVQHLPHLFLDVAGAVMGAQWACSLGLRCNFCEQRLVVSSGRRE